jgi:hypothetical protein
VDITEGNRLNLQADGSAISANGCRLGGLLAYDNHLIGSSYAYYDGGYEAVRSHFKSGLTLNATGDFEGMSEVGFKPSPVPQAGFVAGFMTQVPLEWQSILGGKVLTGQGSLSVIGRTSSGPAAFAFDPDQLGVTPAPATALLYYPLAHQTIGTYDSSYTLNNMGSMYKGVVFPPETRSIIYTGRQGLGEYCYGEGTTDITEKGNTWNAPYPGNLCRGVPLLVGDTHPCCYDPSNTSKGGHAYPYASYAWAYDAEDLARVKNGGRIVDDPSPNLVDGVSSLSTETYMPWDIKPYAYWDLNFPLSPKNWLVFPGASTYDSVTRRLFIVQAVADDKLNSGIYNLPLIHVYELQTCSDNIQNQDETGLDCGGVCGMCATDVTAPDVPSGVSVN